MFWSNVEKNAVNLSNEWSIFILEITHDSLQVIMFCACEVQRHDIGPLFEVT